MLQGVEILSQEVVNTVKCNYSILVIGDKQFTRLKT